VLTFQKYLLDSLACHILIHPPTCLILVVNGKLALDATGKGALQRGTPPSSEHGAAEQAVGKIPGKRVYMVVLRQYTSHWPCQDSDTCGSDNLLTHLLKHVQHAPEVDLLIAAGSCPFHPTIDSRNLEMLLEYRVEDWVGRREGRSVKPSTVTPLAVRTTSPGRVYAQLPPASDDRSTMTEPGA
jgi:hypothetical protein